MSRSALVEYLRRVYPSSGIEVTGKTKKGRMVWTATVIHPGENNTPWAEDSRVVFIDFSEA